MRPVSNAGIAALALCLSSAGCAGRAAAPSPPGSQRDATFTRYSPLSRDLEVARRTLTPLTFRAVEQALSATGRALRDEPVDLSKERFSVYVPAGPPPPGGYGLLVFVAPWRAATRPIRWRPALDRHRLIFVSAENSGNDVEVLDRRVPLALLACENVRAEYPIDAGRIYVAGFSGGSRVAQIVALAYPDLFRGALLNAGSDPIDGEKGTYIPPAGLFQAFQRTRLVYVTGEHDELNLHDDDLSRASMKDRCVFDVASLVARRLGHEALDPISLDRALDLLDRPSRVDAAALEECNARLRREVAARLADAEGAIARGDRKRAMALLRQIDAEYGGLAAPAILELEAKHAARK